jgi:hypothetical protein
MGQVRWVGRLGALAMTLAIGAAAPAPADVTSDRAAAIVKFPLVTVANDFVDTVIQISNTSREAAIDLHCFYINANSHCTNSGDVCIDPLECCGANGCGACVPGWNETDFRLRLTPEQPLAWRASQGLAKFPLDGVTLRGPDGSSNAGSRVPPVPEDPFIGELKCIAVDPTGVPVDRNVLKGEATVQSFLARFDVAKYNAVGIQAIEGAVNDDKTLVLGGEGAEYNGCPSVTIVNHFAEFVTDPVTQGLCIPEVEGCIETSLILVPCGQDLLRQVPPTTVVQYLVYNEFEQRFSTSRLLRCQQALPLSLIDTTQRQRSIFSAGVLGTTVAQTRLTPISSGLVGVAVESHDRSNLRGAGAGQSIGLAFAPFNSAAFNLHFQGDRADSDLIVLP